MLDFLKKYRFARSTKRKLEEEIRDFAQQEVSERFNTEVMAAIREIARKERERIHPDLRTAEYNAGYTAAVRDLFGVRESAGFQAFAIDGRHVTLGPDGRMTLES